jgi:hypothetical protein
MSFRPEYAHRVYTAVVQQSDPVSRFASPSRICRQQRESRQSHARPRRRAPASILSAQSFYTTTTVRATILSWWSCFRMTRDWSVSAYVSLGAWRKLHRQTQRLHQQLRTAFSERQIPRCCDGGQLTFTRR